MPQDDGIDFPSGSMPSNSDSDSLIGGGGMWFKPFMSVRGGRVGAESVIIK